MSINNVNTGISNIFSRLSQAASSSKTASADPISGTGALKPISGGKWQTVLQNALNDGGPVDDVKTYADRSGASGDNEYFAALGYDA